MADIVSRIVAGIATFFLSPASYLFGVNVLLVLHYSLGASPLQHSHIWLRFPFAFEHVLVSPAMHMIHHSSAIEHHDKNFGFTLSIWDQMAGTRVRPGRDMTPPPLGLSGDEQDEMQSLAQLHLTPIRRILLRGRIMAEARRRV